MTRIETIDAHTAGEPLRLIVGGFPAVEGRTILEQREYVREHHDHLRRALMLEPRGHADMYGAILTPPEHAGSHAGALERGLIIAPRAADGTVRITLDAPAGPIEATAVLRGDTVTSVRFRNVPSFVLHPGVIVRVNNRDVRADVAFGGAFYAIVDSEAVGIPVVPQRLADLRRVGMEIKHTVEAAVKVVHPLEPQLEGIYGTIFTGPSSDERADLRNVTIFADAEVDRSPCGTGTAAVMAVLHAMGMLTEPDQVFRHESIVGSIFRGRVLGVTSLSTPSFATANSQTESIEAIIPEIEGSAHVTGEHTFIVEDSDPFKDGFRL
jgi:trans-L-3-hydroxyproline dehydratase